MGSIPIVGSRGIVSTDRPNGEEMARRAVRVVITLACTECREHNYTSEKNRRNDPSRLELEKYCPRCRRHRLHRETK